MQKMAKVVLILELVCAIIQQEANKCFFDNKEKVHQETTAIVS